MAIKCNYVTAHKLAASCSGILRGSIRRALADHRSRSAPIVEAQRGNVRQAIAAMRSVLAEEPGYYTGWSWLWEWCRQVQDYRGCLAAGEALVRIGPQYEISLGYLGEAKRLNNDRPGAYTAFQRAFELNPGYEYAGNAMFDLQLADGRLNDAEATLALLQRHSRSAAVGARAVQLAARGRVVAALPVAATVDGQLASHSAVVGTFQSAAAASIQCTAQDFRRRKGSPATEGVRGLLSPATLHNGVARWVAPGDCGKGHGGSRLQATRGTSLGRVAGVRRRARRNRAAMGPPLPCPKPLELRTPAAGIGVARDPRDRGGRGLYRGARQSQTQRAVSAVLVAEQSLASRTLALGKQSDTQCPVSRSTIASCGG